MVPVQSFRGIRKIGVFLATTAEPSHLEPVTGRVATPLSRRFLFSEKSLPRVQQLTVVKLGGCTAGDCDKPRLPCRLVHEAQLGAPSGTGCGNCNYCDVSQLELRKLQRWTQRVFSNIRRLTPGGWRHGRCEPTPLDTAAAHGRCSRTLPAAIIVTSGNYCDGSRLLK